MLDDGIYSKINNHMFRPIAAIFMLLQFFSKSDIYIYIYNSEVCHPRCV